MFSFFKRFKGSKAPDDTPETPQADSGADVDVDMQDGGRFRPGLG